MARADDRLEAAIDWTLLHCILLRIVCSEPWAQQMHQEIELQPQLYRTRKSNQADALEKARLYPPGGKFSSMPFCQRCCHHTPLVSSRKICWPCFNQSAPINPPSDAKDGICELCRQRSNMVLVRAVCLDCYYCGLPDAIAAHVPSSPGSTYRANPQEIAGQSLTTRNKTARRTRRLSDAQKESPVTPSQESETAA